MGGYYEQSELGSPRCPSKPSGPRPKPPSKAQLVHVPTTFSPANAPYSIASLVPEEPQSLPPGPSCGTFPRGTLFHKGFYDLLNLIPNTASTLQRADWIDVPENNRNDHKEDIGPSRYQQIPITSSPKDLSPPGAFPNRVLQNPRALEPRRVVGRAGGLSDALSGFFSAATPPRQTRVITKDMISAPTGFVHLVHASDAEQAETLLTCWGPDGMGKIAAPYWAGPIKNILRNQAALRNVMEQRFAVESTIDLQVGPSNLHVVNGGSAITSSTEASKPSNINVSSSLWNQNMGSRLVGRNDSRSYSTDVEEVTETATRPGTIRIRNSVEILRVPTEDNVRISHEPEPEGRIDTNASELSIPISITSSRGWLDTANGRRLLSGYQCPGSAFSDLKELSAKVPPPAPSAFANGGLTNTIRLHDVPENSEDIPAQIDFEFSVLTLDRAASCKIYFENLYFSILRKPLPREQRRLSLENDLAMMTYLTPSAKEEIREQWRRNESDYLREKRQKVSAEAFTRLKVIGHGAFGIVSLVREKMSGKLYAMKQLRKVDMLRKGQEGHIRAEREVLKSASLVPSPNSADWIVKLHYSFQDKDNLYLVLDYMGGGDLLNLLIEHDIFEENFTRFYAAEMVLAIEQCHKQGFIHRDIKPDNFLFDPQGHIKLSDFGLATDLHWAHDTSYYEQQRKDLLRKYGIDLQDGKVTGRGTKKMSREAVEELMGKPDGDDSDGVFTWREKNRRMLAYSVCGTNSYMSPEVIRGQGYSFSCDWWSLGVILFECLYGYPPFSSNSRHITRQMILNWRRALRFPSNPVVSRDGINFLEQLICEREDRLGSQASYSNHYGPHGTYNGSRSGRYPMLFSRSVDGAEYIKAHPWFRGIDWTNMHKQKPPYRPNLRNPADTSHFDDNIPAETLPPANGAPSNATKDPVLKDQIYGSDVLEGRKKLAFMGFTHKSPRAITYPRAETTYQGILHLAGTPHLRNNSTGSVYNGSRNRALSL